MKRIACIAAILVGCALALPAQQTETQKSEPKAAGAQTSAGQDVKNAGRSAGSATKKGAKATGRATTKGVKKVGHVTKKTVHKGAEKVEHKTE